MDFSLSTDHEILRESVRSFAEKEIKPVARELDEKESQFTREETVYRDLKIDLENVEFEFVKQETQAGKQIGDANIALLTLRYQHGAKLMQYENEEKQLNMKYRSALAAWEAASVVTFDDLDDDNFLKVRAPVSGVVTAIAAKQKGEKVKAESPLVFIAPSDTEKVVLINIQDKDRGRLKIGQKVKLKFPAFPWHRHGFINGSLEFISPGVKPSKQNQPYFEGRVGLDQDYFVVDGNKTTLRYGMTATAEISVQKRRLIDLALDPFRKLKSYLYKNDDLRAG